MHMALKESDTMQASVVRHSETNKLHGALYINHLTPSGFNRWLLWLTTEVCVSRSDASLAANALFEVISKTEHTDTGVKHDC